jgi:hypothetical protein
MWLVARLCPPQFLQDRSQVVKGGNVAVWEAVICLPFVLQ